ncbi:Transcription initiation factor TFIID subunit [Cryptosporidium sp. chipmunk genotype I]|uniref:Transcription initiation factor TFIID subunit n=1 Tax=Cryptosporidium sp. chipmunk genotype I TaxID=1280935 RepID=UPI003519FC00|nr:Transcription initiation factor TFIID subunit [Cryptosporidium sp. chipmunk genotype I]
MEEKKYIQVIPDSVVSIRRLLRDMKVESYDPRIIDQLLSTAFAFSQDLIIKSNEYARIDSRKNIQECDAKIAISEYYETIVANQNSNLANKMVSSEINSLPLPKFPNKGVSKIWLPTEYEMSITPNWNQDINNVNRINESEIEKMNQDSDIDIGQDIDDDDEDDDDDEEDDDEGVDGNNN